EGSFDLVVCQAAYRPKGGAVEGRTTRPLRAERDSAVRRSAATVQVMRWQVPVALVLGLTFYALVDILLWQRIFEASGLYRYDHQYHAGYVVVLGGMIAVGMVLLARHGLWALWYGLAFATLAFSGLEDALYYVLDGQPIPASLPWLDADPLIPFRPVTGGVLLESSALWLGFWALSLVGPWLIQRRRGSQRLETRWRGREGRSA
ncbi:MAG TPA: hypothetical protein VLW53_23445, partial [Candidatus Eisenbacteria bacterium]|nr:hypothetical protein [Candidatus Eisenbacteria bacterium]